MNQLSKILFQVGFVALVLSVISYLFIDKTVAVSLSQLSQSDFFYKSSAYIDARTSSKQMIYVEMLMGAICSWFILQEKNEIARKFAMVFLSYFIAYVVTFSIKVVVARYRPELFLSDHLYGFSWFNTAHAYTSMPSGHATVNFALALSISASFCLKCRFVCIVLILYSIAVAISRVVVNAHYISDVLIALTVASWSIAYVQNLPIARRNYD